VLTTSRVWRRRHLNRVTRPGACSVKINVCHVALAPRSSILSLQLKDRGITEQSRAQHLRHSRGVFALANRPLTKIAGPRRWKRPRRRAGWLGRITSKQTPKLIICQRELKFDNLARLANVRRHVQEHDPIDFVCSALSGACGVSL
jgi:hypothetical protein